MSAPRFTTLLLDLDGTLLDVEMRSFLEAFFPLAAARFGGPAETHRISQAMTEAARAMMEARDGARTVDLVFLESFAAAVGCTPAEVRTTFAAFYREEFERLHRLVRPVPGARAFVVGALGLGCELVLATNPVFFLDPIRARLRWAGLADVPFALVTGAELMFWTKPHAGLLPADPRDDRPPPGAVPDGRRRPADGHGREGGGHRHLAGRGRRRCAAGCAPRRPPGDARAARGLAAGDLTAPRRYFRSHSPSRRISLLLPPGSSAVSEALKTT